MRNDSIDASKSAFVATESAQPALTRAELHRLVRYWVGMLKEAGLPPEEVLIAVKALVRDTIVPRYKCYADEADEQEARIAFVRDASQWCIDAYFETTAKPNESPLAPTAEKHAD